jgi:TolB-like protein/DNA-binding winged helix-turn-helix (wHTH) protein
MSLENNLEAGFQLGPYRVYPRRELIVGPDETHHVENKVMRVLLALSAQAQQPVTRQALLDDVWAGTVVGDEVLSRAVSMLRGYFNDTPSSPTFIRTIPKTGYELILPVQPLVEQRQQKKVKSLQWLVGTVVLIAVVALTLWWWPNATRLTVAVLPFDTSGSPHDYLSEGVADGLITDLSQYPNLSVVSRRSSFALRDPDINAKAVGEELGADYIVEGRISSSGPDAITVEVVLIDTASGTNAANTSIIGSNTDLQNLKTELSTSVSALLEDRSAIRLIDPTPAAAIDEQAYRAYLEARYQWSLRGNARIGRAIDLLRQAIAREPDFADAHLALAQAVVLQPFYSDQPVAQAFQLARASADRARRLDTDLTSDVLALEGYMLTTERDWSNAEARLREALRLNEANILANYWMSMLLSQQGHFGQALEYARAATLLDPISPVLNDRLAVAYLWENDMQQAAAQYRRAADLGYLENTQPKSFVIYLNRQGQHEQIRSLLARLGFSADWADPFVAALNDESLRPQAIEAISMAIQADEIPASVHFGLWVLMQDADRAFRDFDRSLKTQDIEFLWTDETAFLREDARFETLLTELKLR